MRRSRRQGLDGARVGVNVRVWLHAPDGARRLRDEGHNLITAVGLNFLRDRFLGGTGVAKLTHLAVGTGSGTPASGDTALGAEVFRDVFTQITTSTAAMVVRYYLGPNDANGNTLREAGLFNAASGGTLFARRLFSSAIVKTIDIAVTIEWTITFAAV